MPLCLLSHIRPANHQANDLDGPILTDPGNIEWWLSAGQSYLSLLAFKYRRRGELGAYSGLSRRWGSNLTHFDNDESCIRQVAQMRSYLGHYERYRAIVARSKNITCQSRGGSGLDFETDWATACQWVYSDCQRALSSEFAYAARPGVPIAFQWAD